MLTVMLMAMDTAAVPMSSSRRWRIQNPLHTGVVPAGLPHTVRGRYPRAAPGCRIGVFSHTLPRNHAGSAWLPLSIWARLDANEGPTDYESAALTS